MKKLIFILFLALPFIVSAQSQPPNQTFSGLLYEFKYALRADSVFLLPRTDTLGIRPSLLAPGAMIYRLSDKRFYGFNGSYWVSFSSGINSAIDSARYEPTTATFYFRLNTGEELAVQTGIVDSLQDRPTFTQADTRYILSRTSIAQAGPGFNISGNGVIGSTFAIATGTTGTSAPLEVGTLPSYANLSAIFSGNVQGIPATAANHFVTRQQVTDTVADRVKRPVADSLYMGTVDNIATLRASSIYLNTRNVNLLGYYAKSDGGQGTFYWDALNAATDDSGTVIKPTAVSGPGRWVRVFDRDVSVAWFGAKGDGVTDDKLAIQGAYNVVVNGGGVYYPTRSISPSNTAYIVTGSIYVNKIGVKTYGGATMKQYSTTIQGKTGTFPLFIVNAAECSFENITLRGNGAYTILDPSGAGRWGENATVSGIRVMGDVAANGDLKLMNTTLIYLDTAVVLKARNAEIAYNIFTQNKHNIIIQPAAILQQRGFKISNNWVHSPGDTCVGRAFVKCLDPTAFQIFINNNQLDGQPNSMLADITADSAVQINGNNLSLGRGGMIKLTGTKGAVISNNYFLGGSFKTAGDGIQLVNVTNSVISNNNIIQAANNGISLVNSVNNSLTGNVIPDPSWPAKATAGSYSGISFDANSKSNAAYNNLVKVTNPSGYPISKFYNVVDPSNHLGLNDQIRGTTFVDSLRMQFNGYVKALGYLYGPYDSIYQWDITYRANNGALEIGRTGFYTPMKLYDNGTVTMNLQNPATLKGPAMLNIGSDLTLFPQLSLYNQATAKYGYIITGSGTPEFSVTAPQGSLFMRQDGGTGTTLYIKESGTGNTGWVSHIVSSIQNQLTAAQTGNFWISGTARASILSLQGSVNPIIAFNDGIGSQISIQMTSQTLNFNNNNPYTTFLGTALIGMGVTAPTSKLDIAGPNGYNQLRLRTSYTPTSTADANGNTGDVSWDANYFYIKTGSGWKRSALTTF